MAPKVYCEIGLDGQAVIAYAGIHDDVQGQLNEALFKRIAYLDESFEYKIPSKTVRADRDGKVSQSMETILFEQKELVNRQKIYTRTTKNYGHLDMDITSLDENKPVKQ